MDFEINKPRQIAALTIAGSDSGGNAGIQADTRAFHVFGLHACTVITALTAQNPYGVRAVFTPDGAFVAQQLDAVLEEYDIAALKTGMLATAEIIEAVAERLERYGTKKLIVDPVMVSTSGVKLLEDDAVAAMRERLLPLALLATPNLPETETLLGRTVETREGMEEAARDLRSRLGCAVLVKGGHRAGAEAEDVLCDAEGIKWYSTPFVQNPVSVHGTGCSLSAAITASLACGSELRAAILEGKTYVYDSICAGVYVGPRATVMGTPRRG